MPCITAAILTCVLVLTLKSTICRLRPCPNTKPDPSSTGVPSTPRAPLPPEKPHIPNLSVELIEKISDFLFETKPSAHPSTTDGLLSMKPAWKDVAGFMSASVELHRMGFVRWVQVIDIKSPEDWVVILPVLTMVREMRCFDGTLIQPDHQRLLPKFTYLHSLTVDAHSDVWHDDDNRFTYRDLVVALPSSLRRLEITHAHGPDIRVIATVEQCCPWLEELKLGRCTMFNRIPACDFWLSFPLDHDSYMSGEDTDSYAHSLAQELIPLQNLKSLSLGLYLVPSTTVLAHRLFHRRGLPAPETIEWQTAIPLAQLPEDAPLEDVPPATTGELVSVLHQQDPEIEFGVQDNCKICVETTSQISQEAETRANTILSDLLPSLLSTQWMGWLTPGHLGVDVYHMPRPN